MTSASLPSLFCGQIKSEDGKGIYFGFEEVLEDNICFWCSYGESTKHISDSLESDWKRVCANSFSYPNAWSKCLNYSEEEYLQLVENLQKKKWTYETNPFGGAGLRGGATGMMSALCRGWSAVPTVSVADRKVFMVYASKIPVTKRHAINQGVTKRLDVYQAAFSDIAMSFVYVADKDNPAVTHYGIFRNALSLLDIRESTKGISIKLHGFAATVALTQFVGKKYMITTPLPSMTEILCKYFGEGNISIGTNLDLKWVKKLQLQDGPLEDWESEELTSHLELLQKYPPRIHCGDGTWKVAKKGVALSEHLDSLPDEQAEFIAGPEQRRPSWLTIGALDILIPLDQLAACLNGQLDIGPTISCSQ